MRCSTFLTTPPKLTGEIRRFCTELAPSSQPVQIKAVPFPGCDGDCFANLPGHVARFGGGAVTGWRLALWPRVLIQAQPHLIWHTPKDELIDVTATDDRAPSSIFLPDPSAAPDRGPVRSALAKHPDLDAWLAYAERGEEGLDAALDAFLRVVRAFARPDSPCYCGSGRQMRKCHPFKK